MAKCVGMSCVVVQQCRRPEGPVCPSGRRLMRVSVCPHRSGPPRRTSPITPTQQPSPVQQPVRGSWWQGARMKPSSCTTWRRESSTALCSIITVPAAALPVVVDTRADGSLPARFADATLTFEVNPPELSPCGTGTITCLEFYGSSHLLSGGEDGLVCVWNTKKWQCLKSIRAHKYATKGCCYHWDGCGACRWVEKAWTQLSSFRSQRLGDVAVCPSFWQTRTYSRDRPNSEVKFRRAANFSGRRAESAPTAERFLVSELGI